VSLLDRAGLQPVTKSEHLNVLAFTPDQSPIACTSLLPKKEQTEVIHAALQTASTTTSDNSRFEGTSA